VITLTFSPKQIAKFSGFFMLGLTIAGFSMKLVRALFGYELEEYHLFDIDAEQTIPSWYSSSLLLLCAGLLAIVAQTKLKAMPLTNIIGSFYQSSF
jgi:hypothetical protein